MLNQDDWEAVARRAVDGLPPPTRESRQQLVQRLRAIRAARAALEPEAVAHRKVLADVRAEMRLTCERYLGREIALTTLARRLRFLEQEERSLRDSD